MSDVVRSNETGAKIVWAVIALLGVAAAGVAVWHLAPSTPEPRAAVMPAVLPPAVVAAPLPFAPLPPPEETDPQLDALFGAASSHPSWKSWLSPGDLVTRVVATIDALSEGRIARHQIDFLAPKGRFVTRESGGRELVDARSYDRYDTFAAVIGSLDVQRLATAYRTVEPILDAGYKAFGYPNRRFSDVLRPALVRLAAPRVLDGDVVVEPKGGILRYADPELEAASDLDKQVWRLGPRNQRVVQGKVRELATALGLPKS